MNHTQEFKCDNSIRLLDTELTEISKIQKVRGQHRLMEKVRKASGQLAGSKAGF